MQCRRVAQHRSSAYLRAGHTSGSYSITPNMMVIPAAMNA